MAGAAKKIYQQKEKIGEEYYRGYQIASQIAELWGIDTVIQSGYLAMCIPLDSLDVIDCPDELFEKYLREEYNCDKKWEKFMEMDRRLIKRFAKNPEGTWEEVYQKMYRKEYKPIQKFPYFTDQRIIRTINQFMGLKCFSASLEEYYSPDCKYPLPLKPMSYVDTEKKIKRSKNHIQFIARTILFHRKKVWDKEDWDEESNDVLIHKADMNEIMHCQNITNLMNHILELGRYRHER